MPFHSRLLVVLASAALLAGLAPGAMAITPLPPVTYVLGDLSLQNGWDGGIAGNAFTNNNANSDVVSSADAFAGTQSWLYGGSYGSPGSGTPFTPNVARVGAPNATTVFGGGMNSLTTPDGDKSVVTFALKAVAPGDGSQINVYEGNRDLADPARTGANIYVTATSATDVTLWRYHLSSTDLCANQDFPELTLATLAAGSWHTVKMTTTYPNVTPSDFSTYGTTTYVIDEGTGGEVTVTDSDASWVHQFDYCGGGHYSPGTSLKWSSSFNDYPTHQGFYIDDVSMTVINTATATTVATFATGFEAVIAGPLDHLVLSPATASVGANVSQAYTAIGYDKHNNSLGDVTSVTSFAIAGGTCAANVCRAQLAGNHKVTGRVGTKKGTAILTVVAGAAEHLAFARQPGDTRVNSVIGPPVTVRILDLYGNLVTTPSASVTIGLGSNPTGATLSGTLTVASVNGVATFGTLNINKVGKGYTLVALSSGLFGVTSHRFNITDRGSHSHPD
ncbi:MAG: hypothetical protein ACRDF7_08255 [Candidatus Limnocylindrales bacterium]